MSSNQPYENERLEELVKDAWRQYDHFKNSGFVINPSMPILFFGDLKKYFESNLKVVTVGLNPSKSEFPSENPLTRFPRAHGRNWSVTKVSLREYIKCLSEYFRVEPYHEWFNYHIEPVLQGMHVSFCGDCKNNKFGTVPQANTALHTDLCSPLSTRPKWTDLPFSAQSSLETEGVPLWRNLVKSLQPDILLTIVGKERESKISFNYVNSNWQKLFQVTKNAAGQNRLAPYEAKAIWIEVGNKRTLWVSCPSTQMPFMIYPEAKSELGKRIIDFYSGKPPEPCSGEW